MGMSEFAAVDVIRAKRDGHALSDAQIDWVVDAYTKGVVADEQMSALAMAILLRGMTPGEIARWTAAMIASGERLDLSSVRRPPRTSTPLQPAASATKSRCAHPLVAACGAAVPQLSGRGLGHTAATLDKLESIPGWRATLTNDEFRPSARRGRGDLRGGDGLAPADRKLYALRDGTGTVEAIPRSPFRS